MIGRDPKWIAAQIGHVSPAFTFSVYRQVATRRHVDEQAIWALKRFVDEPAERDPSRQITRSDSRGSAVETGEFDRATERLAEAASSHDDRGVSPVNRTAAPNPRPQATLARLIVRG